MDNIAHVCDDRRTEHYLDMLLENRRGVVNQGLQSFPMATPSIASPIYGGRFVGLIFVFFMMSTTGCAVLCVLPDDLQSLLWECNTHRSVLLEDCTWLCHVYTGLLFSCKRNLQYFLINTRFPDMFN